MSNQLSMVRIHDILTLVSNGLSQRQVAKKLQIHRQTVGRYLRLARQGTFHSDGTVHAGSKSTEAPIGINTVEGSKSSRAPAGNFGQKSGCEPFRTIIEAKIQQQLTAQRIWQDLKLEQGFTGSYYSVRRFVRQLEGVHELPFRRMECHPGEQVQVDFGLGAPIKQANGRMKRPHVFRMVLSFFRKAYSEAVWRQDTETFLRCLENAFHAFGGVPRTVVVDNLKAAVIHPDWYDPQLNPKLASFGEHYGTVILPTRSYTPRHKGKVERQVGYVQDNGLKGRTFETLAAENTYLGWWEANVADQRIHGTTRQQVRSLFEEERPTLSPLPCGYFPFFQEGERSVHRDGHVEVDKAYYSVPSEYTGLRVLVRYDNKLVRVFNSRMQPIAIHCKLEPGRFSTDPVHIHKEKIAGVERGAEYHLRRTQLIGPWSHLWAKTMLAERGIPGVRVLVGFVSLTHRYSDRQLEKVCQIALKQGCYHLRSLRHLLQTPGEQPTLPFMEHHPMIRPMKDYQDLVAIDFGPEERTRIIPFPSPDPNETDQNTDRKNTEAATRAVPRFDDTPLFTGDETHDGKSQIHAQTASALGTHLESEVRLQEASGNRLSHLEFLELLIGDELNLRNQRQLERRTKIAGFRELKTLEDFDWSFNPSVKRDCLYELATGNFIRQAGDVLFIGPPGVGKSHLVQALGYQAIRLGFTVLYRSIFDLVRELMADETFAGQDRILTKYLKPDLLIIDDMGIKHLPKQSGEYLFEIILRRHQVKSTIMTSNRPIEDWGKLIGDVPAATAILDRFLSQAQILAISGKSYRLKNQTCKKEKE